MRPENILQTLQRYATIAERLEAVSADQREFEKAVVSRLDRLDGQIADVRERLARLEASRVADRGNASRHLKIQGGGRTRRNEVDQLTATANGHFVTAPLHLGARVAVTRSIDATSRFLTNIGFRSIGDSRPIGAPIARVRST